MVSPRYVTQIAMTLFIIQLLHTAVLARVRKRANDIDRNALIKSGWKVPLEGGKTCTDSKHCITSLKPPPFDSSLQFLTIGRGTITYSCDNRSDTQTPIYTTQDTFLYDASPLIPKFSSENQFHSYIPRFLEYDYTSLDNSSLTCIGNVQRVKDYNIFTIYNVDAFPVKVKETVHSPDDPQFDLDWLHVSDYSQEWDVYRVETAGGGPPYNCGDQIISDTIPVEYVAEYWFYRKSQSDSKALKRT